MTPPLTPDHLAELRRLAEEARVDEAERAGGSGWYRAEFFHAIIDSDDAPLMEDADAAYIAAVSPDVVLALLEAARREARVRAALRDVMESGHNPYIGPDRPCRCAVHEDARAALHEAERDLRTALQETP